MFTLIHGEDLTASRNYYHELKQKSANAQTFEGDKVTLTELTQILEGGSLFIEKQEIFLEHLVAKKKDTKELAAILALCATHAKTHDITFWEGKELTKKQVDLFSGATVKIFKLPQSLFAFLESLKPGNTKQMLTLYHQTLTSSEPEMIFFMLTKQLRILLALHDSLCAIDEVKRIAPWQKTKLQKQSQQFSQAHLTKLYHKLATLDLEHKTGGNVLPFTSSIDFFLLEV